jgi:hypothetical protein
VFTSAGGGAVGSVGGASVGCGCAGAGSSAGS